jgi:hypothetical protein
VGIDVALAKGRFAVLAFAPHTTTPPRTAAAPAAIAPGSNRITPSRIAASTIPPPAVAIREARMNLRQLSILPASPLICSLMRTISSCGSPSRNINLSELIVALRRSARALVAAPIGHKMAHAARRASPTN